MKKIKYSLIYDFHTMVTIPDVGAKFDAEAFIDQVKSCGVDFLTWHARCNQGNAYYNTKIGTRHPSLTFDMIREIGNACHRKGIRLSVYFNGLLSDEELIQHPEWRCIGLNGETFHGFRGPFIRRVCYNSPYREHLRDMVLELAKNYPVDGFFFDCLKPIPCICETCVQKMKDLGIAWRDAEAVRVFANSSAHHLCEFLNKAIREVKPDAMLYFNDRPFEEVIHMESHLECECLPTSDWGYETLPILSHYMRTVTGLDKQVLNMTGRFNSWGDFGGLRTAEGLEYDFLYGIANGMRPEMGGHFHPRGDMDIPVFDRIREVFGMLQKYDSWSYDAVNDPEIALVYPRKSIEQYPNGDALIAAVRMLTELKVQFDFVSEFSSWDKYKLLIFPDNVLFSLEIEERIKKHLERGGKVLATSSSGLVPDGRNFAIGELWPAVYEGAIPFDPVYFQPEGKFSVDLPDMPLSVYASGCKVKAADGSKAEMYFVEPYQNVGWDGLRSNYYAPPRRLSDMPFILCKGNIIYCAAELFTGYGARAPNQLRQILSLMLNELMPSPQIKCRNVPSFARVFLQKKANSRLIHVLAYMPEKRCSAMVMEDRLTIMDTEYSLRLDGMNISKVYLAPDRHELPFEIKDGFCNIKVPRIDGYALIVFE